MSDVTISRADAETVWIALDTARGYHVADDLARQYKNTGGTHRPSNITTRIEGALAIVDQLLQEETDGDQPVQ